MGNVQAEDVEFDAALIRADAQSGVWVNDDYMFQVRSEQWSFEGEYMSAKAGTRATRIDARFKSPTTTSNIISATERAGEPALRGGGAADAAPWLTATAVDRVWSIRVLRRIRCRARCRQCRERPRDAQRLIRENHLHRGTVHNRSNGSDATDVVEAPLAR